MEDTKDRVRVLDFYAGIPILQVKCCTETVDYFKMQKSNIDIMFIQ